MPWHPGVHDGPGFYRAPLPFGATDEDIDYLLARRKEQIAWRDELLGYQKLFNGPGDRHGARYFGREAATMLKEYRATCYVISVLAAQPPGDCRDVHASPDLAPWIDHAMFDVLYRTPAKKSDMEKTDAA